MTRSLSDRAWENYRALAAKGMFDGADAVMRVPSRALVSRVEFDAHVAAMPEPDRSEFLQTLTLDGVEAFVRMLRGEFTFYSSVEADGVCVGLSLDNIDLPPPKGRRKEGEG